MNCQEALNLLYDIIDKEASEIDTQQVQEHLSRCRHCSEIYKIEKSVNALLKAKMQASSPAPCVDALKLRVLNELDAVDGDLHHHHKDSGETKGGAPSAPSFRIGRYLAVAAALVVVAVGIFYATRVSSHSAAFVPIEQAHMSAVDNLDAFRNSAVTMNMIGALNSQLYYSMEPEVHGFYMVGGRSETIDSMKVMHFIYRNAGDKVVSVFVADQHYLTIPDELKDSAINHNGTTFFDHNCHGCHLVYHQDGPVVVVTATTDHSVELLDFVPGHRVI